MQQQAASFHQLLKDFRSQGKSVIILSPALSGESGIICDVQSDHITIKVLKSGRFYSMYLPMCAIYGVIAIDEGDNNNENSHSI